MVCNLLFQLYSKVVNKVCKSSSILSAETSKLIENSQRDLNVAFVNEIAIICDKLKIKSSEALNLASTKWNFLNFKQDWLAVIVLVLIHIIYFMLQKTWI